MVVLLCGLLRMPLLVPRLLLAVRLLLLLSLLLRLLLLLLRVLLLLLLAAWWLWFWLPLWPLAPWSAASFPPAADVAGELAKMGWR